MNFLDLLPDDLIEVINKNLIEAQICHKIMKEETRETNGREFKKRKNE
jgi:hypothetical protein